MGLLLVIFSSLFFQVPLQIEKEKDLFETISVQRKTIEIRVLTERGQPLLGLREEDFILSDQQGERPILSCQWIETGQKKNTKKMQDVVENVSTKGTSDDLSVRKLIFFFQGDISGQRNTGILKGGLHAREMIKLLNLGSPGSGLRKPGQGRSGETKDLVCVFSFVSHLRLHSDWTSDPLQLEEALSDVLWNRDRIWPSDHLTHCLEDRFDAQKGKAIASPEAALAYIGELLEGEKGIKSLFFIGWGLGRYSQSGVQMTPNYSNAVQNLTSADVMVFSLDISQADYHSLEVGMQQVSKETGGFYERTYPFTSRSFDRVISVLVGYYLLTFEPPIQDEGYSTVGYQLKLRNKKGRILLKSPHFW